MRSTLLVLDVDGRLVTTAAVGRCGPASFRARQASVPVSPNESGRGWRERSTQHTTHSLLALPCWRPELPSAVASRPARERRAGPAALSLAGRLAVRLDTQGRPLPADGVHAGDGGEGVGQVVHIMPAPRRRARYPAPPTPGAAPPEVP